MKICSVENCVFRHLAKGFCKKHYYAHRYAHESGYKARILRSAEHRHGFTPELEARLLLEQNGRCAICTVVMAVRGQQVGRKAVALCRDHCHGTNRTRALLCDTCNKALGVYEKHQRPAGLRIGPYDLYLERYQ